MAPLLRAQQMHAQDILTQKINPHLSFELYVGPFNRPRTGTQVTSLSLGAPNAAQGSLLVAQFVAQLFAQFS